MRVTFIATVFNEGKDLRNFLKSLNAQRRLPDEIVIIDGGSTDGTFSLLTNFKFKIPKSRVKIVRKKGNRSVGRNEAIRLAKNEIIVCSDAGNILDKDWIKNIVKPFTDPKTDVVSGYYKARAKTLFQKCLTPYVLVMPDRLDPLNFLPATRSIGFKKSIWKKVKGFDERYSHNEDYAFAQKLKQNDAKIAFVENAIANWIPRNNFKQAFTMFFRFALGDTEAGILRNKVLLLLGRYTLFMYIASLTVIYKSPFLSISATLLALVYIVWAALKNYKYVKRVRAFPVFIALQFTADASVLLGTTFGILKRLFKAVPGLIMENKAATLLILIYALTMLSIIRWGIPNDNHPFLYHMDEWHQAQAVRTVFTEGTPNIEGSAHGTIFHFYLTGLYLAPLILTGLVDPFAIKTSIDAIDQQHILFILLRLNTLLYGIGSMIFIGLIGKKFFKIPPALTVFLFSVTPAWYSSSNYFKYDIALIFWVIVSFYFILNYSKEQNRKNFLIAGVTSALACATKVSAGPIFLLYLASFFIFSKKNVKNLKTLFLGVTVFTIVFIFTGIPDTVFGKGNIFEYLSYNLITLPKLTSEMSPATSESEWIYLFATIYPLVFGPFMLIFACFSSFLILTQTLRKRFRSLELLIIGGILVFFGSLIPLGLSGGGNRIAVLLPFVSLITGYGLFFLKMFSKKLFAVSLIILIFSQILITSVFMLPKFSIDVREKTSQWIYQNVPSESEIGVTVPPIYTYSPDIVLKEYYELIYNPKTKTHYIYQDNAEESESNYIIIYNEQIEKNSDFSRAQKPALRKIYNGNYEKIAEFKPPIFSPPLITDKDIYFTGLTAMPYSLGIYVLSK